MSIHKNKIDDRKSLTQQQYKESCNINDKIRRFTNGEIIMGNQNQPRYGNFTNPDEYHIQLTKVNEAKAQFMQLPAKLRQRFSNSPRQLIEFLSDTKNEKEAQELGIIPTPGIDPLTVLSATIEKSIAAGEKVT